MTPQQLLPACFILHLDLKLIQHFASVHVLTAYDESVLSQQQVSSVISFLLHSVPHFVCVCRCIKVDCHDWDADGGYVKKKKMIF